MSEYSVQQKTFKFPMGKGSPGYKDQHMYLTFKGYLSKSNINESLQSTEKHLQ